MVNALRAALVSVASGFVFCSLDAPHQCLTAYTAGSAATITVGAMLWAASKPAAQRSLSKRVSIAGLKRA
jgi:hypothetical protein